MQLFSSEYSFRRLTVMSVMALTAWVTAGSVAYATDALIRSADWAGTVAIIGAIQTPVLGLAGYVFKLYNDARSKR